MQPQHSYFICATPRSGSNLLCEALRNTGVAGKPEEYFWDKTRPAWYKRWGISNFDTFIEKILEEGSTSNGVFGVKMFAGDYFEGFVKNLRQISEYGEPHLPVPALMAKVFPDLRYVWITRRNKVRQAVSWWMAFQTNVWAVKDNPQPRAAMQVMQSIRNPTQRQMPQGGPQYDFEKIDSLVQEIIKREAAWQEYFTDSGVTPFSVIYEDLAHDYQKVTRQTLEYLQIEIPGDVNPGSRELQKQAGPLANQWVLQYLEEKQTGWQPTWHDLGGL